MTAEGTFIPNSSPSAPMPTGPMLPASSPVINPAHCFAISTQPISPAQHPSNPAQQPGPSSTTPSLAVPTGSFVQQFQIQKPRPMTQPSIPRQQFELPFSHHFMQNAHTKWTRQLSVNFNHVFTGVSQCFFKDVNKDAKHISTLVGMIPGHIVGDRKRMLPGSHQDSGPMNAGKPSGLRANFTDVESHQDSWPILAGNLSGLLANLGGQEAIRTPGQFERFGKNFTRKPSGLLAHYERFWERFSTSDKNVWRAANGLEKFVWPIYDIAKIIFCNLREMKILNFSFTMDKTRTVS